MNDIVRVDHVFDYNDSLGCETLHPLVSVIDFSEVRPIRSSLRSFGVYAIFLKDVKCGDMIYGRQTYDYQEGTLVCLAPGQVFGAKDDGQLRQPKGWALLFHPDLLRGTQLGRNIRNYTFFSYEVREALHLSEQERRTILDCLHNIRHELQHAIDRHSRTLVVNNIEMFLNYCVRFYDRQFITRSDVAGKDILARIQFLPALLAVNVGVVAALVVATLLFGRIYCSVVCPLGVMQDGVSWAAGRHRKNRFRYSPAKTALRYTVLALFIAALAAGIGSLVALLAPYSAYGRIAQNLLAPLWGWGNNLLAYFAERIDSYAFYRTDVWVRSAATFAVAAATFALIAVLAWRNGRTWCNTVCPVGTVLGFLARFSLLRPAIDTEKCVGCNRCARNCKASCIDVEHHRIDYSRCVVCMDCIDTCHKNAIAYELRPKTRKPGKEEKRESGREENPAGLSRRSFLSLTGIFAAHTALRAQEKLTDGGLAVIEQKKIPRRATPIVPAGAASLRNMAHHCTGCQLCVAVCPNGVLRPSEKLTSLMQPEMSYERGYCRPECTKCSEVCPAGAILPVTAAEKSSVQIGHAVWIRANCVPLTDGVDCGNCARHCPSEAITMVPSDTADPDSPKIPVVNTERCIGCGACENLCPARPFSAIYVEGHERHRTI